MNCDEFKFLVHAYVDSELDEAERVGAEVHLATCEECRGQARHVSMFREAVRAGYQPESAPEEFKERLRSALEVHARVESKSAGVLPPAPMLPPVRRTRRWLGWSVGLAGLGAAAAAALFIVNFGLTAASGVDPALEAYPDQPRVGAALKLGDGRIVRESLSWHRRQVPIEVTGPDSRRINHWFKGKVDFRVKAPRFDRRGLRDVNLLGARLSNVRDRQAAYVVYEVDGSKVSVLIFDRNGERPRPVMRAGERGFYNAGGYNVAVVEQQGVTYSITSDLPQETHLKLVNAAFRP